MKKISILVITALILLFLFACQSPDAQEEIDPTKPVIKIAYMPITHSIPLLVQQELEKDSELPYRIELIKFTTWPELVDALRQNKVDGASVLFEVALKAYESSEDLKMVSLSHRDGNVVVSNNNAESLKDLKDHTIAIPHKLSPHNTLLHMLLEKEGMTIDDVNVVELAPADMPSSLATGAISAFIVAEPYGSISVSSGAGKILYTSNNIDDHSACCAMVFHNNFLSANSKLVESFFDGFMKAAEVADKKDEFVVNTYENYMNLKKNVIEESLKTTSFSNLMLSEQEYNHLTELAVKYGILDFVPEYDAFMYNLN